MATITAKIFRYDPSVDEEPHYSTHEVEWIDDGTGIMTALQVLHAINYDEEAFGYDHNCSSGLCGRCSMLIDGKPGLACWTPLEPGEHTFEPLPGFPVIKDLVVDRSKARQQFVNVDTTIHTVDPIVTLPDIDYELYWETLERLNMCRECMQCYAVCPVLKDGNNTRFVGPGAMGQIAQRYFDTEDQSDRLGQAVFSGLWDCTLCGECTAVCPSGIKHVELFQKMQEDARERGLVPSEDVEKDFA